MPRGKKELAEQITPQLREVEVEVGGGKTVLEAVKKIGVTEQTYSLGRRSSVGGGRPYGPPARSPLGVSLPRLQAVSRALRCAGLFRWHDALPFSRHGSGGFQ